MYFLKKSGRLSSTGSEILTFGSHCLVNFQPILDCFIPKFKLEYDNLENIKAGHVNAVVFNLHQIKRLKFFLGYPVVYSSDGLQNSLEKLKVYCDKWHLELNTTKTKIIVNTTGRLLKGMQIFL